MVTKAIAAVTLLALYGCSGNSAAQTPATSDRQRGSSQASDSGTPTPVSTPGPQYAARIGHLGKFRSAWKTVALTEAAHNGPVGRVGQRTLTVTIWYPSVRRTSTRFPLIVFGPGFLKCSGSYAALLSDWASAGFVVAAVNFPLTNCHSGNQQEEDVVNQPADMSFVLTELLGPQSGDLTVPVDPHLVTAAGQSDGGDTVTALASSQCCTDNRFKAIAVLSGQNWPYLASMDFTRRPQMPMLFTQGTADYTYNPPSTSLALYLADKSRTKYYLTLYGADHLTPYTVHGATSEKIVAEVTVAFFAHYLLALTGSLEAMQRDATVPGIASLVSG